MTAFSLEAASRWDAVDLQRELAAYSPWLMEVTRDRWYVRGSLGSGSAADLHDLLARWATDRALAAPEIVFIETSPVPPLDPA